VSAAIGAAAIGMLMDFSSSIVLVNAHTGYQA
jgi:hypothetical protein